MNFRFRYEKGNFKFSLLPTITFKLQEYFLFKDGEVENEPSGHYAKIEFMWLFFFISKGWEKEY